jgi:UTP--glucose-1-phosphate uridylyltransferase
MPDNVARVRAVKAVIPAAGLATRFLPATKAVPKEMLNVVDRPVLQYVVEEAAAAGIDDVLLVTARGKTSIVDHFDRQPYLESRLEARGDERRLELVRELAADVSIFTCRQAEPLGLGNAVSYGEKHVGREPFAVLLGDEFVETNLPLLPAMIDLQERTGGIVLAFLEVEWEETSRYGIASVSAAAPELVEMMSSHEGISDVFEVVGLVEKPPADKAPSRLAVLGRYILPATIFDAIKRVTPGAGDEIQLTDAMALLLAEGVPIHGVVYRGTRYDTGLPLGYLQTVVQLAAQRDDLGPAFREWLIDYVRRDLGEAKPNTD